MIEELQERLIATKGGTRLNVAAIGYLWVELRKPLQRMGQTMCGEGLQHIPRGLSRVKELRRHRHPRAPYCKAP